MGKENNTRRTASTRDIRFVQITAAILLVSTIVAFMPRYLTPIFGGQYDAPNPWMHPHAFAGFVFAALFLIQPTLIARGKVRLHRTLGKIAGLLVILAVISGVGVQFGMFPAQDGDLSNRFAASFRLFQTLPAMVIFFGSAILLKRKTDWHWRLMYLAAFAAFNTVSHRLLKYYSNMQEADIMPLVGILSLAPVILLLTYDLVTYRRVHLASWAGLVATIFLQGIAFFTLSTDFWARLVSGS